MTLTEGIFTSADKKTEISYSVYTPDERPMAVVQLIHGMCEYVDRYKYLAEYLTSNGIVFCGADNLGHGRSAKSEDDLGFSGDNDGAENMIEDTRQLYQIMRKKYRRLPYIMLGHSMGSFILRAYMTRYGDTEDSLGTRLDGAVITGTNSGDAPIKVALFLSKLMIKLRGPRYRSKLLRNIVFKDYNKKFPKDGEYGWLTRDSEIRKEYAADPKCSFMFTAAGYRDMLTILKEVTDESWAASVPLSLPVFVIGGSDDPVGNYGNAPRVVADALRDAEVNEVDVKVYEGYRHELFFEVGRENVCADLVEFVNKVAEGVHEARMSAAINGFHVPLTTMGDYEDKKD